MTEPSAISKEWLHLAVGEETMRAYVARPSNQGPYPGIIVLQEAFGVNLHIRDVTERMAEEGYVAIAPELYHRYWTRLRRRLQGFFLLHAPCSRRNSCRCGGGSARRL